MTGNITVVLDRADWIELITSIDYCSDGGTRDPIFTHAYDEICKTIVDEKVQE